MSQGKSPQLKWHCLLRALLSNFDINVYFPNPAMSRVIIKLTDADDLKYKTVNYLWLLSLGDPPSVKPQHQVKEVWE